MTEAVALAEAIPNVEIDIMSGYHFNSQAWVANKCISKDVVRSTANANLQVRPSGDILHKTDETFLIALEFIQTIDEKCKLSIFRGFIHKCTENLQKFFEIPSRQFVRLTE